MTTTAPPRVRRKPGKSREFSFWHEQGIEHLLTSSGLDVRREPKMDGKTPDLLVTGPDGMPFVIECIARLPDPAHAQEMQLTGMHVCEGGIHSLHANVYSRLDQKACKYRAIAAKMPYVIALYDGSCLNSLQTAVDMTMSPYRPTILRGDDGAIRKRSYDEMWPGQEIPGALFELYPHLSGLIYSRWPREHHYLPNPNANRPVHPSQVPFASVPALPDQYRPEAWLPSAATVADDTPEPPEPWLRQLRNTSNSALHHLYST